MVRTLATVVCLVAVAGAAHAQALTISVRPPLPNQLLIGDPWSLDAINGGATPVRVVLRARVTEAAAGLVFDATSAAIEISPGTHVLDARRLGPITVRSTSSAIGSQLGRLSSFPDGTYTICVEAIPEGGGSPLGEGCIDHAVASVLPPILLSPYNGTAVTDPQVIWSWFMQPQARGGGQVVCDLMVAEIMPHQTPEEALRRNPPVLVRENLRASVWQTSEVVRRFRPGQSYAWRLTARLGDSEVGQSEIWTFTYAAPAGEGEGAAALADSAGGKAYAPGEAGGEHSNSASASGSAQTAAPGADASGPRPIEFHTRSRVITETANRPGLLSREPRSFARLEVDPTLTVYGSPLALNLLVSTERGRGDTEISRGAVGFQRREGAGGFALRQQIGAATKTEARSANQLRADSLRHAAGDSTMVDRSLDEQAALPPAEPTATVRELTPGAEGAARQTLTRAPDFAFGSVAPEYSRLTLSGVTFNGGTVEYHPGRVFAALAAGKLQREDVPEALAALPLNNSAAPQLFRDFYAGRLGIGRRDGSHLIATSLYARDDAQSRSILSLADSSAGVSAQENWVLGLAGRSASHEGRWVLDAEADASLFDSDRAGARIQGRPDAGPAAAIFPGQRDHEGATADWAGAVRGSMTTPTGATKLASGVRFVGPGYASVGTRGLRTDVLQYDGSCDQRLADGRVTFGAQLTWEETGVVLPERGNAVVRRISTRTEIRPARGPVLQAAFTRNDQEQRPAGGGTQLTQSTELLNLRLRHTTRIGPMRSSSFLSFDLLQGASGDETGRNRSRSIQFAELLSHPSRLTLFVRASHSRTTTAVPEDVDPRVTTVEGSLIRDLHASIESNVGANVTYGGRTRGQGFFLGTRARLGGVGSLELRWDYDDITDPRDPAGLRVERTARMVMTFGDGER
jgi:hypothetical protein